MPKSKHRKKIMVNGARRIPTNPPKQAQWDIQGLALRAMMGRLGLNEIDFYNRELQLPSGEIGMSLVPAKPDDLHACTLKLIAGARWAFPDHKVLTENYAFALERLQQAALATESKVFVSPGDVARVIAKNQELDVALRQLTEQVDAAVPVGPSTDDYASLLNALHEAEADYQSKSSEELVLLFAQSRQAIQSLLEYKALWDARNRTVVHHG